MNRWRNNLLTEINNPKGASVSGGTLLDKGEQKLTNISPVEGTCYYPKRKGEYRDSKESSSELVKGG